MLRIKSFAAFISVLFPSYQVLKYHIYQLDEFCLNFYSKTSSGDRTQQG
ncbi:hypothetical protein [Nostoc sp.]